jgi:hypothetical protein
MTKITGSGAAMRHTGDYHFNPVEYLVNVPGRTVASKQGNRLSCSQVILAIFPTSFLFCLAWEMEMGSEK